MLLVNGVKSVFCDLCAREPNSVHRSATFINSALIIRLLFGHVSMLCSINATCAVLCSIQYVFKTHVFATTLSILEDVMHLVCVSMAVWMLFHGNIGAIFLVLPCVFARFFVNSCFEDVDDVLVLDVSKFGNYMVVSLVWSIIMYMLVF